MKWLILSDNDDIKNRCSEYISKGNRKDKVLVADLTVASLKSNKKYFRDLAACIIFANDDNDIEPALGVALSAVFGYFASEKVPVLTNMKLLCEDVLFGRDTAIACKSADILYETLVKQYNFLSDEGSMRIAKQSF